MVSEDVVGAGCESRWQASDVRQKSLSRSTAGRKYLSSSVAVGCGVRGGALKNIDLAEPLEDKHHWKWARGITCTESRVRLLPCKSA